MHECEFSSRVEMWVGVLVRGLSVSGPACVADAESSGRRLFRHEFSERSDSPGALACFDAIAVDDGNPCGIVAAILKTAQTIEQDRSCLRTSDVTDNATHGGESVTLRCGWRNQVSIGAALL